MSTGIFSFTQRSSRRVYRFGASAIMDKSNKSQRQTCDQDMSSTFYPVASEKSMDEILGQRHNNLANGKTKKSYLCKEQRYTVVQFLEGYTMFMYQMLHILDLHFKSINQGSDHPSFVGAAKYSTILDTKQGAV